MIKGIWAKIRSGLQPAPETGERPDPSLHPVAARYVRSFLWLRILVGILGIMLPLLVVLVDHYGYGGSPFPRGSVSIYYYASMRDVFVATVAAMGIFFVVYKIGEWNRDAIASTLAGLGAIVISQFPTLPPNPAPNGYPTLLQGAVGVHLTSEIHYIASGVFLGGLAAISFDFARREGSRPQREGRQLLSSQAWEIFHYVCTGAMLVALGWILFTSFLWDGSPSYSTLIGEWIASWAFGFSWLCKGSELDMLFGTPRRLERTADPPES